ncbi:MAG TPA: copper homeostasis periplasmic binding protein CopC [Methylovirgula sp.]|jgi:methionine-rich copper-binding protein CopC|nr:copper homeostasis periplasmic binding protein CopC [Methylovirgula sp.]
MRHFLGVIGFAFAGIVLATAAFAHAHLDRAVPAVGATVAASPEELQLTFTQDVVLAFSGVSLKAADGKPVAVGKPIAGPANTLHVKIDGKLAPGKYTVTWHAVSVDTHRTQGDYQFTIAP